MILIEYILEKLIKERFCCLMRYLIISWLVAIDISKVVFGEGIVVLFVFEADIFGDSGAIRVYDCGTGSNAGPRTSVCERATAMESCGAGKYAQGNIVTTVEEARAGNTGTIVGERTVAGRVLCARHWGHGDVRRDPAVHTIPEGS